MNNNPLVSIIVPIYNVSPYITVCLESIINQTYKNLEIILVNDGSTDNSLEICKEYANKDKRILLIDKINEGVSKARIDGFNYSHGEYVYFVDADDYLDISAVDKLMEEMGKSPVDIVCSRYYDVIDNVPYPTQKTISGRFYNSEITDLLKTNFLFDNKIQQSGAPLFLWGKLYRKDILIDALDKGLGYWYGEDVIITLHLMMRIKSVSFIEDNLYYYVHHIGQTIQKAQTTMWKGYLQLWENIKNHDVKLLFKKQMPQRIWMFSRNSLSITAKEYSFPHFYEIYKIIRYNSLVWNEILDGSSFFLNNPKERMCFYLLKYKQPFVYYLLTRYK